MAGPDPTTDPSSPAGGNDAEAQLAPLRQRIDAIDQKLVELLNERASVVVEVGQVKRNGDAAIFAPHRERKVLDQIRRYNLGPLPDRCLEAIWRELMSGSFALERPLRIGYLGPAGSFSHLAAKRKFGDCVDYVGAAAIGDIFGEITRQHIDLGLVPIENSNVGGIGETLDALIGSGACVAAEVLLRIHMQLLSNAPLSQIARVYSKPEAMSQCTRWLDANLPSAERIAVASTSRAAELAAQEDAAAAVGCELAGEIYGLTIPAANIEDNPHNTTRFFVIGRHRTEPTGDDKTSLMFSTANEPGALTAVLDIFRDHGLNLTQLTSRPSRREHWHYIFFVDLAGHADDPKLQSAIDQAREHCHGELTILGSYPRAQEPI